MIPKQYPHPPAHPIDTPPLLRYYRTMKRQREWIMSPGMLVLRCGDMELARVWIENGKWRWQTTGGKWGEARYSNWACMEAEREVTNG